jgi:alpha-tubulin suppressor-like RCC1 family protein
MTLGQAMTLGALVLLAAAGCSSSARIPPVDAAASVPSHTEAGSDQAAAFQSADADAHAARSDTPADAAPAEAEPADGPVGLVEPQLDLQAADRAEPTPDSGLDWGEPDAPHVPDAEPVRVEAGPIDTRVADAAVYAAAPFGVTTTATHACAWRPGGGVWCWGANTHGQLGDGTHEDQLRPIAVPGLDEVVQVSVRASAPSTTGHSCAVNRSGEVWCWGANKDGQLGQATTDDVTVPAQVEGLGGTALEVSASGDFTCALLGTGQVQCWGQNRYGQLGDGTMQSHSYPVSVKGLEDAVEVGTVVTGGCARRRDGRVACWGSDSYETLGNGADGTSLVAADVQGLSDIEEIAMGNFHVCVRSGTGRVSCWGNNRNGTLGSGSQESMVSRPVQTSLPGPARQLAEGQAQCALLGADQVWCWGGLFDAQGLLVLTPAPVCLKVESAAGLGGDCAVLADRRILCWGLNDHGRLGTGDTKPVGQPTPVVGWPPA